MGHEQVTVVGSLPTNPSHEIMLTIPIPKSKGAYIICVLFVLIYFYAQEVFVCHIYFFFLNIYIFVLVYL